MKLPSWTAPVLAGVTVLALAALLLVLSGWRDLPGYGGETDFLGSIVDEAQRLLQNEPLLSEFHPPGFPVAIAAAYLLVGDWFVAGKALAVLSSAVALIGTFWLFRGLAGNWAAWGAVGGLASSATFLKSSMEATSDVYFFALFTLAVLSVLIAARRRSLLLWYLAGVIVGLGIMTRTNGLTLILLLAAPFIQGASTSYRLKAAVSAAAGLGTLIFAFVTFAALTGSNLFPSGTFDNLAMTYFSEQRIAWEGVIEARERFKSLKEVLLYDPMKIATTYARDLFLLLTVNGPAMSGSLLALLFFPGLVLLIADRPGKLLTLFLLVIVAQILLVNFKAFQPRYYLFLAPWIGAGAGYLAWRFSMLDRSSVVRGSATSLVIFFFITSITLAGFQAMRFARNANPELTDAVGQLRENLAPGDVVVARKPHVGFLTGATNKWLPDLSSDDEMSKFLLNLSAQGSGGVYLFYGQIERRLRPEMSTLVDDNHRPFWLVEVASGSTDRSHWSLYRYFPGTQKPDAEPGASN